MTRAGFLGWAQVQEARCGFDGNQPVAVSGGPGGHARIIGNIAFRLRRRLGDGPCEVLASDAGSRMAGDAARCPDALVTCSGFGGRDRLVPGPALVFEVVSPFSIREDRALKPAACAAVASVRRPVLVEQSVVGWRCFGMMGTSRGTSRC